MAAAPRPALSAEFALIERCFTRPTPHTLLGIGDDAALLAPPAGEVLAITTDTLVSGVHFFADADPYLLGRKALAVNLSDLAAMAATPRWALLALTLPQVDDWCRSFAQGLHELAAEHTVELIGGDTTHGPLSITITAIGSVPPGQSLRRDAARAGDDIWLSGRTGEAALALRWLQGQIQLSAADQPACLQRLHNPIPRVELALALRGLAHAAIDVSDGLVQDLGHICRRSGVAAWLDLAAIPRAPVFSNLPATLQQQCLLGGGDDYELLFTAPATRSAELAAVAQALRCPLTRIGRIIPGSGVQAGPLDAPHPLDMPGYDHFA